MRKGNILCARKNVFIGKIIIAYPLLKVYIYFSSSSSNPVSGSHPINSRDHASYWWNVHEHVKSISFNCHAISPWHFSKLRYEKCIWQVLPICKKKNLCKIHFTSIVCSYLMFQSPFLNKGENKIECTSDIILFYWLKHINEKRVKWTLECINLMIKLVQGYKWKHFMIP